MADIVTEQVEQVLRLTLNRPEARNAFTPEMQLRLRHELDEARGDESVRAVLLTGAGRAFCAGMDLKARRETNGTTAGSSIRDGMRARLNPLIRTLVTFPKPVVTAVNGAAVGAGVGLALATDIVLAGRSASFHIGSAPRMGLLPDAAGTWLLPRLIGRARARGAALLGEPVTAEVAESWGMIWRCVEDAELDDTATNLARQLAHRPREALRRTKALLDLGLESSLAAQLDHEAAAIAALADAPDFHEAVQAFRQGRAPHF
ncbi:MAG: 2-(1,2-epoxy-1,2-dihydrophenyl)acetyl-CoA isomerase [Actinophytocola sp.]|uniref:enoyl-CoA hydratase-related protein n=1 Tax=Actinophytocola sp. TaxID=1872138 RepID=UPI00132C5F66|nr:enoyl-CoA hydratase-related protein [Actinophytocola sp.]MPZ80084.1 2-(1,2-epoxy-1,2-dihydrophenyl)acetyl-CoA isomerase [Actinophytocola sp.]